MTLIYTVGNYEVKDLQQFFITKGYHWINNCHYWPDQMARRLTLSQVYTCEEGADCGPRKPLLK